ncbi:MAG: response regulator transcription factor, partial [Oscillospiraceae bacterium]
EYDLVMLDVMLPGTDGFSLCRYIRQSSSVPVLFLTARGREEDKLFGYDLGCDDYIVKPFSLAELYAKTNAMLRRAKGMTVLRSMTCGKISLEPVKMTVTVDGVPVELPPKEYEILKYLMEHKEWVIDRETLLTHVWGYDYFGGDRVVDNHIKKLRKALGKEGDRIKTVISKGYKLTDKT